MFLFRRLYSKQQNPKRFIKKHHPANPGIDRQSKLFGVTSVEANELEDFDDYETDLMDYHRQHREMEIEMKQRKEREKYFIVKQKYFKEKFPNFLTWHDKEQIRYLHSKDPEEWNPGTLSEGFPALPEIIHKIIKGRWSKDNKKIQQHDRIVKQNWQDFKQGKLNHLPAYLKEHLQKFSERSLNLEPFEGQTSDKKDIVNRPKKLGDFSQIIASYEEIKNKNKKDPIVDVKKEAALLTPTAEIQDNFTRHEKVMTFKELQRNLQKKLDKDKYLTEDEKAIVYETMKPENTVDNQIVELQKDDISSIIKQKSKINNDQVGFVTKTNKDLSHLIYPEKIIIPPKYVNEGCTYKLNDCYYDSEGEFLYRVPGMG